MRKTLALAALLTATAFTPALAQDNGGRGDRGDRGGPRMERPAGNNGGGGDRGQRWQGGGGWQRGQQAAPAPAAQPQPQAQPQQQVQQRWNGNRGDGGQRNWGGRQDGQRNWQRNDAPQSQLGGTPAAPPVAVNRDNRDGRRWDGNRDNNRGERGGWNGTFGNNGQAWQQNQNRNDSWRNNQGRNDAWRNQQRGNDNRWSGGNNYRPDRNWNGNRAWTRDWRRDQQYDWQRYRYSNRDLFRARPYYAPRGWGYGYQRFSIGFTLSSILFDQQYWIDDPYEYRLPPAYGPYRWVRYYDDVLLVDIRTGQVVDVINDFFW